MDYITNYIKELWGLTVEMAPYLLFGFFFAGLLHIYLQKEKVGSMLNGRNFRSVLNATLLGIPLPLCSCGVIPAGLSFHKNGASKGASVSFLISTPQTGVDSILVTYSLLGLPFAIIRPLVALVTGVAGGLITNKFDNKEEPKATHTDKFRHLTTWGKTKEVFYYGFVEFIQDISKWLIIGLMLAALLAILIPDNFFVQYINYPWLNMLLVLVASVPLYVCATGSVPIAAVLIMKGLSPGAALVFLMAGPATNLATITVLTKSLGKRATMVYLGTIIVGALVFGFLIDSFLPTAWFEMNHHNHANHDHNEVLPAWLSIASAITLIGLIVNGYIISWQKARKAKQNEYKFNNMQLIQKFKVEGMTCKNCKAHVERNIASIEGVEGVVADFATGEVSITGKGISAEKVKDAVEKGGYVFGGTL